MVKYESQPEITIDIVSDDLTMPQVFTAERHDSTIEMIGVRPRNRTTLWLAGVLVPGILVGGSTVFEQPASAEVKSVNSNNSINHKCPEQKGITIIGHRGTGDGMYRGLAEDTNEAATAAIRMGVDEVENDIQQTRDKELVMHHDATWNRMTSWQGQVRTTPSSKLSKIRNEGGDKVPTLKSYLKTVARTCAGVMLENKKGLSNAVLEKEVQLVDKYFGDDISRVTFSASETSTLKKLKRLSQQLGHDIRTALILRGKHEWRSPARVDSSAIDILNVDHHALTAKRVKSAHKAGFLVSARRVNDLGSLNRVKKWDIDRAVVDINEMADSVRSRILRD